MDECNNESDIKISLKKMFRNRIAAKSEKRPRKHFRGDGVNSWHPCQLVNMTHTEHF